MMLISRVSRGHGPTAHVALLAACAVALTALFAFLVPAGAAQAAPRSGAASPSDAVSWGVAPAVRAPAADTAGTDRANYAYSATAGGTIKDAVVITNHSSEALALSVYAADAFTTSDGQLDLLAGGKKSTDLGAWTAVADRTVRVAPHATKTVAFTVHVPKGAAPGDHTAGIVTSLKQQSSSSTVTVDRRLALRMHLRVAGALAPTMQISDVEVSAGSTPNPLGTVPVTVRYRITNTGNARIAPTGTVALHGPFGAGKVSVVDTVPEILPGSSVVRTVTIPATRPLGPLDVTVSGTGTAVGVGGGASAMDAADSSTWAVPWAALVVVLLVLTGALLVPRLVESRRRPRG